MRMLSQVSVWKPVICAVMRYTPGGQRVEQVLAFGVRGGATLGAGLDVDRFHRRAGDHRPGVVLDGADDPPGRGLPRCRPRRQQSEHNQLLTHNEILMHKQRLASSLDRGPAQNSSRTINWILRGLLDPVILPKVAGVEILAAERSESRD